MGQSLETMTQKQGQSKEELLCECVRASNVDAIRALHLQGANLEWIDGKGKTPLIVACMDSGLINVAETLIQLGANINAYRPGRHGGTPLHHAAKRGLESTVKLLLSRGANVLVRNDDCHTALDVARIKGHTNVVRAIESHMCYFSGWLREFYGPGFLEALAPHLLTRKIWAVVIPCGSGNPMKPLRFELAIYSTLQDAQPRTVISLLKAKIDEPKFHQSDPALNIFDQSTKIRYKLASANEGDKQQLQWLCNACRGIRQVMPSIAPHNPLQSVPAGTHQPSETIGLAMENNHHNAEEINANGWENSTAADSHNGWGPAIAHSEASYSGWMDEPKNEDYNGWDVSGSRPNTKQNHGVQAPVVQTASVSLAPSAPPISDVVSSEGPIHYPSIENSKVDLYVSTGTECGASTTSSVKDEGTSSSCVICWEAPIEAACIPCGHMAGCMSCLNEINTKKGVCPVCRSKIKQEFYGNVWKCTKATRLPYTVTSWRPCSIQICESYL
ncbi:hypothetical protein QYF36_006092 [Acer negundo]|nr:hypothetical protein QYF36_006092 [Acer negundo]